jgi:cell division protein FtsB
VRRLNCTVRDKRGVNGDCMEFHAKGKYLRYTEANAQVEALVWKCDKQEKRIAELEKDIAFLQSCVNSGETATKADRPSERAKALKAGK